jgi:hypothetical protein
MPGKVESGRECRGGYRRGRDNADPEPEECAELPIGLAGTAPAQYSEPRLSIDPEDVLCAFLGLITEAQGT